MEKSNKDTINSYRQSWIEKRLLIKNLYSFNERWSFIINEIFRSRIQNYYFSPIKKIIKTRNWKWEWFSIVWLECILIETLWAFEEWLIFNHKKWRKWPSYEYKTSEEIFTKYLTKYFPTTFDDPKSILFFQEVRCWILHEWRTKDIWKIHTSYWDIANEEIDDTIISWSDSENLIYRNNLFFSIKRNFDLYILKLLDNNPQWEELRKNLWRKLDHMFEIPQFDRNWFDWWT
jgi:hypothetical protein